MSGRHYQYRPSPKINFNDLSVAEVLWLNAKQIGHQVGRWAVGPWRRMAIAAGRRVAHQVRRNLTSRRLLSFPHVLVVFWVFVLLYGERWVFDGKVANCDWDHWEKWVCLHQRRSSMTRNMRFELKERSTNSTTAERCETSPPCLRCRSPAHRSAFISWPTMASKPPDGAHNRQLSQARLWCYAASAAPRQRLLPW